MSPNTTTASITRAVCAAFAGCILTTACSTSMPIQRMATTPTPPQSLKDMPPPDAVLELIQRVMNAAKTGVMANEDLALKTLGLALGPSTKPGVTRKIITGIAALDDDEELPVFYGINRDPSRAYKWEFSIRSLGALICVTKESADLIDSNFGANEGMSFGLHEGSGFGGRYFYSIYNDKEKTSATFTYWRRNGGKRCLDDLLVRQTAR